MVQGSMHILANLILPFCPHRYEYMKFWVVTLYHVLVSSELLFPLSITLRQSQLRLIRSSPDIRNLKWRISKRKYGVIAEGCEE